MAKDKKVVYIAGPMRGYEHYNFPAFMAAEERLVAQGFKVFNPATMDLENDCDPHCFPDNFNWDDPPDDIPISVFILRDVTALTKCTHIYMLKGWETSTGANTEWWTARWLKLNIIYEDNNAN